MSEQHKLSKYFKLKSKINIIPKYLYCHPEQDVVRIGFLKKYYVVYHYSWYPNAISETYSKRCYKRVFFTNLSCAENYLFSRIN